MRESMTTFPGTHARKYDNHARTERRLRMKYSDSLRRAIATFVFAIAGVAAGTAAGDLKVSESALWAGVGALLNFAYRAAEAYITAKATKAGEA
jgi:hypothetical protein